MNKKVEKKNTVVETDFPLGKINYRWAIIGAVIILIGFALLSGGPEDIYNFRKTILAHIVIMGGFVFEIFAIMKSDKS
jgi:uncharacterized membrane protein